jgi:hypothetical protein
MRKISAYDYLLLVVGTTSAGIMLLMIASLFSPIRALAVGLVLALIAAVLLRTKNTDDDSLFHAPDPWLVGFMLLALFLRGDFSTNYIGGQDEGLYVAFSGILEHFGGPYYPDVFRSTLPDAVKKLYDAPTFLSIIPIGDGLHYYSAFYPLHPGWMAVFSGLFGDDMHGLAVLLFSLLGVTGAYFLTYELAENDGRLAARLAALLMTINPALCFLAKFPLSETQTAALLLNAAYLLTKGLKANGETQLFLLTSSFLLVVGNFFTRPTPFLVVPWGALYLLSCSKQLDGRSVQRLRAYLWMLGAACVLAGIVYYTMQPYTFGVILDTYRDILRIHAIAVAAIIALGGLIALAFEPIRSRLQPLVESSISIFERAVLWLPLVVVLASIPSVITVVDTGRLFYWMNVAPGPANIHYTTLYRWMLAVTPFLWCLLLALPWLVKRQSALTILLLFVCATLVLTNAYAPALPYLYFHIRYLSSEIVPFSLVIVSIVLITMWRMSGWGQYLAAVALLLSIPVMLVFSAVQIQGKEGEDPVFFHELDREVGGEDVLIVDEREIDNRLTVPLRYYFNKQLFVVPRDATAEQIQQIVDYLLKNSGSKYGRILLLSRDRTFRRPLTQTVVALLTYTQSFISNSEHVSLGVLQSDSLGRFMLPYAWRTRSIPFTLYRVNGVPTLDHRLSFGCPIDFSENGNSVYYVISGWSDQEAVMRWTDGAIAVLRVLLVGAPNADARKRIYLDFRGASFDASQRVIVIVDGKQVSELKLEAETRDYEIEVNLENSDANFQHEIVFKLPDAHSPKSVGVSQDTRQLGISMSSLTFFDSARTSGKCN